MKYPVTLALRDKNGTIVGAQTCSYSWDVERLIELAEPGESILVVEARVKPDPVEQDLKAEVQF